jgi:2-polyprenyl-3-methyl-5-hydroxy-6-metoxy-1,4-benzoquinol methylase
VHGHETDQGAIDFARKVFPLKNLYFNYGDILKQDDETVYDWVLMIDVLEHIEKDKQALKQVKKLLCKDGSFIISTPNRLSRYRKAETHVREYSPKELETILRRVFISVELKDYKLDPLTSPYENPILAICKNIG